MENENGGKREADSPPIGLDVVIVNWNTGPCLRRCLRSLADAHRRTVSFGTIAVVDNASIDDSTQGLDAYSLPLRLIRNHANRGFAAACNQGAREGDSPFLLFLNPDTEVFPDTLDRSVAFMADPANATVGICGAQMLRSDGSRGFSSARFPTLGMALAKMLGLSAAFPGFFRPQRIAPGEAQESPVDQVIGAYFLTRRSVFEALGGFDDRFFVYMEDVDFAYRANQLNQQSYLLAGARVRHRENVSSEQVRGRRLFYLLRSRTEYALKHWSKGEALILAASTLLVELPVRVVAGAWRARGAGRETAEATRLYARYLRDRVKSSRARS